MIREITEKTLMTLLLVSWYIWMPQIGYVSGCDDIPAHFLYMMSHANVWHLLGNLFVFWLMRGRLHLFPSLVIAVVFSFVPVLGTVWDLFVPSGITMGFSGVIFAMIGIRWGLWCSRCANKDKAYKGFGFKVLPFSLVGILIPHVNWCLHLYCLMAGFVYGRYR